MKHMLESLNGCLSLQQSASLDVMRNMGFVKNQTNASKYTCSPQILTVRKCQVLYLSSSDVTKLLIVMA